MPTAKQSITRVRRLLERGSRPREKSAAEEETDRRISVWLDEAFPLKRRDDQAEGVKAAPSTGPSPDAVIQPRSTRRTTMPDPNEPAEEAATEETGAEGAEAQEAETEAEAEPTE